MTAPTPPANEAGLGVSYVACDVGDKAQVDVAVQHTLRLYGHIDLLINNASEDARARILSRTPMKRLGQPSEIADVVAWLASDAASCVTGEIVTVDGGRMALNYTVAI